MTVPSDVIFIWTGTNASIPTGWTRETTLDSKYILGATAGNNGGGTGGASTHDHPNLSHTHDYGSHTHTFTGGAGVGLFTSDVGTVCRPSTTTHTHASTTSNAAALTSDATEINFDVTSNDPPHVDIIFCKSNGTNDIADDMVAFWDSGSLPTNWLGCDGNDSTPNLDGQFLKGATAGGNSNLTSSGSSNAHTHTNTAHSHTNTHGHTAKNSAARTGATQCLEGANAVAANHTHSVSLDNQTITSSSDSSTVANGDATPPYKTLTTIQNQNGGESLPDGIIGIWISTAATIPTNWARYSAMDDYFLKSSKDTTGTTGGANTHTHTQSNGHTQAVHTHTATAGNASTVDYAESDGGSVSINTHTHTWTIGNSTAITVVNNTDNVAANTSKTNYPEYVTCIFIKYTAPVVSAGQVIRMICG
jgi:hypothetical protein